MKKLILLVLVFALCLSVVGCSVKEAVDPVKKDLEKIEAAAEMFEKQLSDMGIDGETVDMVIEKIEEFNEETKYVVEVLVENTRVSVLKLTLHLPVDETFFESVEEGDVITGDDLITLNIPDEYLNGWKVTIKDKTVREQRNP